MTCDRCGKKPIIFILPKTMKKFAKEPARPNGAYIRHQIKNQTGPRVQKMSKNSLKKIRESILMSKAELARRANISPITIRRIESGMVCRIDTKRKIILALGLKMSDKNKVFGEGVELSIKDKEDKRSGVDRRIFSYNGHIPEHRSGSERRTG